MGPDPTLGSVTPGNISMALSHGRWGGSYFTSYLLNTSWIARYSSGMLIEDCTSGLLMVELRLTVNSGG